MRIERIDIDARGMVFDALAAGPARGDLVLLLHGFPQSAESFRPALRTLAAAGHRVVALNQRGYSDRARPRNVDAYAVDELVEDVRATVAALGRTRAHIVGHDWGGTVAWLLAMSAPTLVTTLLVLSTPHPGALREALHHWPQRQRMLYVPLLQLPLLAETAFMAAGGRAAVEGLVAAGLQRGSARRDVDRLRRLGPTGALSWYRAMDRDAVLRRDPVEVPTMYVWGDADPVFSREAAERTEQHTRGPYHFVELQGASHWIPDQHWDDMADLATAHLRRR